ncbi:hypothetical protein Tco_1512892, partial [Tanacetum coccineum]
GVTIYSGVSSSRITSSSSITGISTYASKSCCCGCSDADVLVPLVGCLDEEALADLELLMSFAFLHPSPLQEDHHPDGHHDRACNRHRTYKSQLR